jgi:myo-inositol-1(or 4)-monophosphatase
MTEEEVAIEAAMAARAVLLRGGAKEVRHKGAVDLVTAMDVACERVVRDVLQRHTPDIPVLGEEGGGATTARTRWVVDPIDGTTNFVHGFPYYATSIGLEVDGRFTVGVIFDHVRDVTYRATRGRGAFAGDRPLKVSDVRSIDQALVATGFAYDRRTNAPFYLRFVQAFLERGQCIRRGGASSLDLALTAAGNVDVYFEFHLARWDISAGVVLVEEAGGTVTPIPGRTLDGPASIIASNGWLHEEATAIIERVLAGEDG